LVVGWIPTIHRQTKYFGKQSVFAWQKIKLRFFFKDPWSNILSDENEILSRWREYFEHLLNPVKAINDDAHEPICFGEEEVFTARKVAAAIGRLKSGIAAGEDEIRMADRRDHPNIQEG